MGRPRKQIITPRGGTGAKYDANNTVLDQAYGAFAELRRELSDSKSAVTERKALLEAFATTPDPQKAWLILEDYFEKLALARKDFAGQTWWPRLMAASGRQRLEEAALLFLRNNRTLPNELMPYANLERFAEIESAEQEHHLVHQLEQWLLPQAPQHLDAPRACLRIHAQPVPAEGQTHLHELKLAVYLFRPRAGEKLKTIREVVELTHRAAHEHELFSGSDWEFIEWLGAEFTGEVPEGETLSLQGTQLLRWLARWGQHGKIDFAGKGRLEFFGEMVDLVPDVTEVDGVPHFTHHLKMPDGSRLELSAVTFFAGEPVLALHDRRVFLLRHSPPAGFLEKWLPSPQIPVAKLSHRLLTHLRRSSRQSGSPWENLCRVYQGRPQFTFELTEDTVRLRLLALTDPGDHLWHWNGHEWQPTATDEGQSSPQILDDPRLDPSVEWLRRLDWFTPEPGVWVGDANEAFLNSLALAWPDRPSEAEYLGDPAFHRLFLNPRQLRPKIMVQGSGIDWFSVSANWEMEGMKLTTADLERLATATGRFVKLPDSGWIELDAQEVLKAHEALADLGLDGLTSMPRKVDMLHAARMDEQMLGRFEDRSEGIALRQRVSEFTGIKPTDLPTGVCAELRPYQKEGFDFLCHLTRIHLGGVLADDMGLGKTLQTLAWLAWLKQQNPKGNRPALVICPASVLHNWRREAERFVPDLKVMVLESGAARHNLRKQIPEYDLIVTNYALLRRDLSSFQKFDFQAIVLDEAQFIKNPSAQVTQSVKQLQGQQRLALTGTPLENRLLDLWSIVDFVQPGYLGSQTDFNQQYEPKGDDVMSAQKVARRRLSSRLRPLMLRRLKKQVAQDLPDRIEERRDCVLGDEQRQLYLAELRRSRDQIMQSVSEQGLAKSKIHVLAALTRLRQVCCHPALVGNNTASGKTETLFELLEPLLAQGQKVLVFSQFVQMLRLLEVECRTRQMPTYMLTGETKNRQDVVNSFQSDPNAAVFLLSLRAAGTGLNLTNASYVVLYDPWWNPAVEAQAIDRSHRIGQTRTVNAYRLITPGTVEEKIWELQQRKAQTIMDVLGEEGFARSLTKSDLEYLFSEE